MTTAADLFQLVYQQLIAGDNGRPSTSADDRVRRPGDLPTPQNSYPVIELRLIGEQKQSLGRGSVAFTTTPVIRIIGKVSEPADMDDPLTSAVEQSLWALKREIETAIINSYPLFSLVQQLVSVRTQLAFTAEATHLAGVQSDYTFEVYEDADDFARLPIDELSSLHALDPNHPGVGLVVDFPQ